MGRWVFIRHGESEANASRVLSGWNDVPLTRRGRTQAQRAGRLLAEHTGPPLQVVSSDLQRAHDTARLAMAEWSQVRGCPAPPIQVDPRLRERNMGVLQGVSIDAARQDRRMVSLLGWSTHPAGGESLQALAMRCLPAVLDLDPESTVVIFAHGGVIRVLSGMVDRLTIEQISSRKIRNAEPVIVTVSIGFWEECGSRYGLFLPSDH